MQENVLLDLTATGDAATLTVRIPVRHQVDWVFLAVTYLAPELGSPIALHSSYARPPKEEEPAGEPGS